MAKLGITMPLRVGKVQSCKTVDLKSDLISGRSAGTAGRSMISGVFSIWR